LHKVGLALLNVRLCSPRLADLADLNYSESKEPYNKDRRRDGLAALLLLCNLLGTCQVAEMA